MIDLDAGPTSVDTSHTLPGLGVQIGPGQVTATDVSDDERRQYYALTAEGKARLNEEAELLATWVDAVKARYADQEAG